MSLTVSLSSSGSELEDVLAGAAADVGAQLGQAGAATLLGKHSPQRPSSESKETQEQHWSGSDAAELDNNAYPEDHNMDCAAEKRAKNREAARRSRQRRVELTEQLHGLVSKLEAEKRMLLRRVENMEAKTTELEAEKDALRGELSSLSAAINSVVQAHYFTQPSPCVQQQQQQGGQAAACSTAATVAATLLPPPAHVTHSAASSLDAASHVKQESHFAEEHDLACCGMQPAMSQGAEDDASQAALRGPSPVHPTNDRLAKEWLFRGPSGCHALPAVSAAAVAPCTFANTWDGCAAAPASAASSAVAAASLPSMASGGLNLCSTAGWHGLLQHGLGAGVVQPVHTACHAFGH